MFESKGDTLATSGASMGQVSGRGLRMPRTRGDENPAEGEVEWDPTRSIDLLCGLEALGAL